jgi:hypothetical protein
LVRLVRIKRLKIVKRWLAILCVSTILKSTLKNFYPRESGIIITAVQMHSKVAKIVRMLSKGIVKEPGIKRDNCWYFIKYWN